MAALADRSQPSPTALPANDNSLGPRQATKAAGGVSAIPSLSSATRDYARWVEDGSFARKRPRDLTLLCVAMGPDIWSWQYARRLTHQPPWRAGPNADGRLEWARAQREMLADIATWERALLAYRAEIARASMLGRPQPPPFVLPVAVQGAIEARWQAAAERAARRRERAGEGTSGPAPQPGEVVPRPPFPGKPV